MMAEDATPLVEALEVLVSPRAQAGLPNFARRGMGGDR